MRTEAEDKGLDSNGDAETLHVELQYCGNSRAVEEWKSLSCASVGAIEESKL